MHECPGRLTGLAVSLNVDLVQAALCSQRFADESADSGKRWRGPVTQC